MQINTKTLTTAALQRGDTQGATPSQRQNVLSPLVEGVRVMLSAEGRKASQSVFALNQATKSQASEETKAQARKRLEQLKERVRLMRQMMIGMTPAQKKAMAPQLKELARELKQIARQLGQPGGGESASGNAPSGESSASASTDAGTVTAAVGDSGTTAGEESGTSEQDIAQAPADTPTDNTASTDDDTDDKNGDDGMADKAAGAATSASAASAAGQAEQAAGRAGDDKPQPLRFSLSSASGKEKLSLTPEDADQVRSVLLMLRSMVREIRNAAPDDENARTAEKTLASVEEAMSGGSAASISVQA